MRAEGKRPYTKRTPTRCRRHSRGGRAAHATQTDKKPPDSILFAVGASNNLGWWSTERVVRRYRTGKSRFYPPQPESSPPSSAFAQVGNCRLFAFLAFNSAQLAQLTTNSGVCSMRPLKRIAHPSFPPSDTHVTSPKVSRNEKRRAPEIGTRLIGFVVRGAAFAARLRAAPPPYARGVAFASTHSRTPPRPLGGLVR